MSMASHAPPRPARTPEIVTPMYLNRLTATPSESAADGFSPMDRNRRPKGVRQST